MAPLIHCPLTLDTLQSEQAVFVGSAEESVTISGPFGLAAEGTYKFPYLAIGRENWEALGRPTTILLTVTELP